MPHGGARQPADPAPVSGPGAASRRTDGGPGNDRQPVRRVPGQPFGEGKQLMEQQGAAPMQEASGPPTGGGGGGGDEAIRRTLTEGVFGPSRRPNEPGTAGAPLGPGGGPEQPVFDEDPDAVLDALIGLFPHDDFIALKARRMRRG